MEFLVFFIFFFHAHSSLGLSSNYLRLQESIGHRSAKIFLGEDASEGEIPYAAFFTHPMSISHCSASIISEQWLLTLADCCDTIAIDSLTDVYYGSTNRSGSGIHGKIANTVLHPDYNAFLYTANLCLIQLNETIQFNENAQPLALAKKKAPVGTIAQVAGWGNAHPSVNWEGSETLKVIRKTVVQTQEFCDFLDPTDHEVMDYEQCAYPANNADACLGDFGDAVASNGTLHGMINFVPRVCGNGSPIMFFDTSSFVDWIVETVGEDKVILE